MDDIFLLFDRQEQCLQFVHYLNQKHPSIKFTIEMENNCKLSFLDVTVNRINNIFETSLFRKPSFTGLGSNFFSFCPLIFKVNALKTLLYRAFHICSSYQALHLELTFLTKYFCQNSFPNKLVSYHIRQFLWKQYDNKPKLHTVAKKEKFIVLPYLGYVSDKMKAELAVIFTKFLPHLNIRITFNNSKTIGSLFRLKDKLPTLLNAMVVYKYSCPSCNASYIGSTTRRLHVRIAEHKGVSSRTG